MRASGWPPFEDAMTGIIALVILAGSFYGLLRVETSSSADARVIYGGLISAVATFYFQRSATKSATVHTIEAQNNGLDQIRQGVTRLEDGRTPTADEIARRDAKH